MVIWSFVFPSKPHLCSVHYCLGCFCKSPELTEIAISFTYYKKKLQFWREFWVCSKPTQTIVNSTQILFRRENIRPNNKSDLRWNQQKQKCEETNGMTRIHIRGRSNKYLAYKRKTKILEKWWFISQQSPFSSIHLTQWGSNFFNPPEKHVF